MWSLKFKAAIDVAAIYSTKEQSNKGKGRRHGGLLVVVGLGSTASCFVRGDARGVCFYVSADLTVFEVPHPAPNHAKAPPITL